METKLKSKDLWFILVCVLISAFSLIIGIKYFSKVFPEASIDFKITRSQSVQLAEEFLKEKGFDFNDYNHAVLFTHDDLAKVFLEREMGLSEANRIMGSKIRLWRWSNRWFKPLQKEEFRVHITPIGELVGFEHLLPEEKEGADLEKEEALALAEGFLVQTMGKNLNELEFLDVVSEKRPNRTDHTFTWKEKGFDVRDATYRMQVKIKGDEVSGYKEFLKVPDKWKRSYEKLRSKNNIASLVASLLFILITLGVLFIFLKRIRNRDIKWKTALWFSLITFILVFLALMNVLPVIQFSYKTTDSYGSFLISRILQNLLVAIGAGAFIFLLTASAEPLYREHYKDKISLTRLFSWQGIRTKRFFKTLILGFTLTFFFFAYQTVFYLLAERFGAWAPAEIPYSDLLNTTIPWVFVLLVGFFPAVSEEFMFRMFAIPFFKKNLKLGAFLAILLPAFIWGFGHANYPNQPFFIRGLEVGIAGVIVGIIFVRFNILAVLVWHFTVDALYTAFLLFRSGNTYFIISAGIATGILLIPLIIALIAYIKTKKFVSEEELLNKFEGTSTVPQVEERVEGVPSAAYHPLPAKRILIGVLAVIVLLCLYFVKVERFGKFVKFGNTAGEVEKISEEFIRSKGVETKDYNSVTTSQDIFSKYVGKYVLQRENFEKLNQIYKENIPGYFWSTRFYKSLEEEEYRVYVYPKENQIFNFRHTIAEDAEGADLTKEEALPLAVSFLDSMGIDTLEYVLKESSSQKKKNRQDHTFVWEAEEGDPRNIEEAKFRMQVVVQGDEVSRFGRFMKLPEQWERDRQKSTAISAIRIALKIAVMVVFFGFALLFFITRVRKGEIRWKPILIISGILAIITLLGSLNELPSFYAQYPTSIPLDIFRTTLIIGIVIGIIATFLMAGLSLGIITSFYPDSLRMFKKENRRRTAGDAFICALLSVGVYLGITQLIQILNAKFPALAVITGLSIPQYVQTSLPFISYLSDNILYPIVGAAILGALIYYLKDHLRKTWHYFLAVPVALIAFVPGDAKTTAEFLF
ncbi:MAG: type II CAAX endopeptidase family protein, partial [Candidatus Zixiibacteriota bacterium]